jgi:hypothetical protein
MANVVRPVPSGRIVIRLPDPSRTRRDPGSDPASSGIPGAAPVGEPVEVRVDEVPVQAPIIVTASRAATTLDLPAIVRS